MPPCVSSLWEAEFARARCMLCGLSTLAQWTSRVLFLSPQYQICVWVQEIVHWSNEKADPKWYHVTNVIPCEVFLQGIIPVSPLSLLRLLDCFLNPSRIFIEPYLINNHVSFLFPVCFWSPLSCRWPHPFGVSLSFPNHFFNLKPFFGLVYGSTTFYFLPVFMVICTVFTTRSAESSNIESSLALSHLYSSKMDFSGSFSFALRQYIATSVRHEGTSNHLWWTYWY